MLMLALRAPHVCRLHKMTSHSKPALKVHSPSLISHTGSPLPEAASRTPGMPSSSLKVNSNVRADLDFDQEALSGSPSCAMTGSIPRWKARHRHRVRLESSFHWVNCTCTYPWLAGVLIITACTTRCISTWHHVQNYNLRTIRVCHQMESSCRPCPAAQERGRQCMYSNIGWKLCRPCCVCACHIASNISELFCSI